MTNQFSRTEMLLGAAALEKLRQSNVAVFGLGGVGGFAAEALARAGVGTLSLTDSDTVALSNLNRQIFALHSTLGKSKVKAAAERLADINPDLKLNIKECFYLSENKEQFDFSAYDYVVDAVDTVSAKISLAAECAKCGTPLISAMGAGNRLDPTALRVADISKTYGCPLAKVVRKKLREVGINHLKVVFSAEPALKPAACAEETNKRQTPGSVSFVPSVMGLIMAGEVIKDLTGFNKEKKA